MNRQSPHRQRGIAIIFAVLMAALVAGLAFTLAGRERLWLFQLENRQDYAAAQSVVMGAVNLARLTVRDDGRNNQVDHQSESWNTPIPAINVEDGKVAGQLAELQGRFNLGNLQKDGKIDPLAVESLGRLFASLGVNRGLADALAAYLKSKLPAENEADESVIWPVDLGELAAVSGFSPDVIRQLESSLVFLPAGTAVNVNFVTPEVLAALVSGLSSGEAQSILSGRGSKHFASVSAFMEAVPQKWRADMATRSWTVQSDYFLVTTESWFGRAYLRYQTLLLRQGRDIPRVVWMKRIQDVR